VDVIVLACFAIAQPLFGVLSNAVGLFVVDDSKTIDVVLLAFGMSVVPGLCLLSIELVAGLFGPKAMRVAHRVILGLLLALTLLPVVKRAAIPGAISIAIALAAGAALVVPYLRARTWRWSTV
jgi:hypothetical protein